MPCGARRQPTISIQNKRVAAKFCIHSFEMKPVFPIWKSERANWLVRSDEMHEINHIMAGVDLRTIQELLGHKSVAMIVRYSHLAPAHTLAAVERLTDNNHQHPTGTRTSTAVNPSTVAGVIKRYGILTDYWGVVQLVGHLTVNEDGEGSNPSAPARIPLSP
jgi:hypothetical protein